jgi:hypothetical protein
MSFLREPPFTSFILAALGRNDKAEPLKKEEGRGLFSTYVAYLQRNMEDRHDCQE